MPDTVQDSIAYFNGLMPTAAADPSAPLPQAPPAADPSGFLVPGRPQTDEAYQQHLAWLKQRESFNAPAQVQPAPQHVGQSIDYFNQQRAQDVEAWAHGLAQREQQSGQSQLADPDYEAKLARQFNAAFPGSNYQQVKPFIDRIRAAHDEAMRQENTNQGGEPTFINGLLGNVRETPQTIPQGEVNQANFFRPGSAVNQQIARGEVPAAIAPEAATKNWFSPDAPVVQQTARRLGISPDKVLPGDVIGLQRDTEEAQRAYDASHANDYLKIRVVSPAARTIGTAFEQMTAVGLGLLAQVSPQITSGITADEFNHAADIMGGSATRLNELQGVSPMFTGAGLQATQIATAVLTGGATAAPLAMGAMDASRKLTEYHDAGITGARAYVGAAMTGAVSVATYTLLDGAGVPDARGATNDIEAAIKPSFTQILKEWPAHVAPTVVRDAGLFGVQAVAQAAVDYSTTGDKSRIEPGRIADDVLSAGIQATLFGAVLHSVGPARDIGAKLLERFGEWRSRGGQGVPPESVLPKAEMEKAVSPLPEPINYRPKENENVGIHRNAAGNEAAGRGGPTGSESPATSQAAAGGIANGEADQSPIAAAKTLNTATGELQASIAREASAKALAANPDNPRDQQAEAAAKAGDYATAADLHRQLADRYEAAKMEGWAQVHREAQQANEAAAAGDRTAATAQSPATPQVPTRTIANGETAQPHWAPVDPPQAIPHVVRPDLPASTTPQAPLRDRIREHEQANAYDRIIPEGRPGFRSRSNQDKINLRANDEAYQAMRRQYAGGRRAENAQAGKADTANERQQGIADAQGGKTTPEAVKYAPLHTLPDELRQSIQRGATDMLSVTKSEKTKAALQKIIQDAGSDTGAAVEQQKERLLGILVGKGDYRNAQQQKAEAPYPPDPIVKLFMRPPEERRRVIDEALRSVEAGQPNELAQHAEDRLRQPAVEDPNDAWAEPHRQSVPKEDVQDFLRTLGGKAGAAPTSADSGFSLAREPAAGTPKPKFEDQENTRQGKLLSGIDALPGQQDLFDDLDKANHAMAIESGDADRPERPAAKEAEIRRRVRESPMEAATIYRGNGEEAKARFREFIGSPNAGEYNIQRAYKWVSDELAKLPPMEPQPGARRSAVEASTKAFDVSKNHTYLRDDARLAQYLSASGKHAEAAKLHDELVTEYENDGKPAAAKAHREAAFFNGSPYELTEVQYHDESPWAAKTHRMTSAAGSVDFLKGLGFDPSKLDVPSKEEWEDEPLIAYDGPRHDLSDILLRNGFVHAGRSEDANADIFDKGKRRVEVTAVGDNGKPQIAVGAAPDGSLLNRLAQRRALAEQTDAAPVGAVEGARFASNRAASVSPGESSARFAASLAENGQHAEAANLHRKLAEHFTSAGKAREAGLHEQAQQANEAAAVGPQGQENPQPMMIGSEGQVIKYGPGDENRQSIPDLEAFMRQQESGQQPQQQIAEKMAVAEDTATAAAIKWKGMRPSGNPPTDAIRSLPFRMLDTVRQVFNPQARSADARIAGQEMRAGLGKLRQQGAEAEKFMADVTKAFGRMPPAENFAFIDRMERGEKQPTPELERFAAMSRKLLDESRDAVIVLGKGKLQDYLENYFPHLFRGPQGAAAAMATIYGHAPLEGRAGFLKKRSIDFFADAMKLRQFHLEEAQRLQKAGDAAAAAKHSQVAEALTPISDNPAKMILARAYDMRRYVFGHNAADTLSDRGTIQYASALGKKPDGMVKLKGPLFTKYGPPELAVKEAYDDQMMSGLTDFAHSLGVQTDRKMTLKNAGGGTRDSTWGLAYGDKSVQTRFAGPLSVLAHEITHAMNARYNLRDALNFRDPKVWNELRNISALRTANDDAKGVTRSGRFMGYLNSPQERIAMLGEAYIHAPEKLKEVAPTLYKRFDDFLASKPELQPFREIKPSLTLSENEGAVKVPGITEVGAYWAPPQVANVLDNATSPGLRGNPFHDIGRAIGNTLNMAQLALPVFHATFTTFNAAISDFSLGLQQLERGEVVKGIGNVASGLTIGPSVYRGLSLGSAIKRGYEDGLSTIKDDPQLRAYVQNTITSGGAVKQDSHYITNGTARVQQAIRELRFGEYGEPRTVGGTAKSLAKAAANSPLALLETLAKPMMEFYVPRLKVAAAARLGADGLSRLGPSASYDDRVATLQRGWDSADNRFGQLVYDNLFWNRKFKDFLMTAVRSVGWNLGTVRELGGAPFDLLKAGSRLKAGDQVLSNKMAYALALPVLTGLWGAGLQYLLTGKGPSETKDFFYPKTGGIRPGGEEDRLALPTYMKDVYSFLSHPLSTAGHKVHPLVAATIEAINNKDFFGNQIYDPNKPLPGLGQYAAKQFVPFNLRNIEQQQQSGGGVARAGLAAIGFTPAPAEIARSPAMNMAVEYARETMPATRTLNQADASQQKRTLVNSAMQQGGLPALKDRLGQEVATGRMTPKQSADTLKRAGQQPLVRYVSGRDFTPEHALDVWKLADDKERTPEFSKTVESKLASALANRPPQAASDLYDRAKESGLDMTQLRRDYAGRLLYAASGAPTVRKADEPVEAFQQRQQAHIESVAQAKAKLAELGVKAAEARELLHEEARRRRYKGEGTQFDQRAQRLPQLVPGP